MKPFFPDKNPEPWVDEVLNSLNGWAPVAPPADLAERALELYLERRRATAAALRLQRWAAAACLAGLLLLNVGVCSVYAGRLPARAPSERQPYDYFSFAQPLQL
jgi:hypothetical protein